MSDNPNTPKSRWRLPVCLFAIALVIWLVKQLIDSLPHVLLSGCDPAWLIKTGQLIIQSGHVPTTDTFSWTAGGRPLICYQWLFEVSQAYLFNTGGLWLVGLASLLCFAVLYFFVLPITWLRSGVRPIWIILSLALVFSPYWLMARPQTVSHLLIFAFIFLMERFVSTRKTVYLAILPPLMVLWNNIHLTSFLGFIIVIAYFLESIVETYVRPKLAGEPLAEDSSAFTSGAVLSSLSPSRRLCLMLGAATVLCIGSLWINPYGPDLINYSLTYTSRMSAADIAELKGLNLVDALFRLIHLALAWIALVALSIKRGLPARWFILAAFATFAFFMVTRLQPLVVLFTWLPVGASISLFSSKQAAKPVKSYIAATLAVLSLAIPALLWKWKYPSEAEVQTAFLGDKSLTLNYYATHCAKDARPFNDSDTGDRLIFLNSLPVFIDSRFDFYGREFFRNWHECIEAYGNWQIRIDRWNPTHLLVKDTYKLYWKLMSSPSWYHVVDDGYLSLWVPKTDAMTVWLQSQKLDTAQLKEAGLEPQLLASTLTGRACKHLQMGKALMEQRKFAESIEEISEAYKLIPSVKILRELTDAKQLQQLEGTRRRKFED